jgi:peptidoglycan/LPS O-acetylase OafA/YrhL
MRVWNRLPVAVLPAAVFVGMAALLVFVLPGPRSPLHYMVAGTLATTGSLVCIFLRLAGAKLIRRSKPEPAPQPEVIVETGYRIFGQL